MLKVLLSNLKKSNGNNKRTKVVSRENEEDERDNLVRLDNVSCWCMCGGCSVMCGDFFLEEDECLCCHEVKHIRNNFDINGMMNFKYFNGGKLYFVDFRQIHEIPRNFSF